MFFRHQSLSLGKMTLQNFPCFISGILFIVTSYDLFVHLFFLDYIIKVANAVMLCSLPITPLKFYFSYEQHNTDWSLKLKCFFWKGKKKMKQYLKWAGKIISVHLSYCMCKLEKINFFLKVYIVVKKGIFRCWSSNESFKECQHFIIEQWW